MQALNLTAQQIRTLDELKQTHGAAVAAMSARRQQLCAALRVRRNALITSGTLPDDGLHKTLSRRHMNLRWAPSRHGVQDLTFYQPYSKRAGFGTA